MQTITDTGVQAPLVSPRRAGGGASRRLVALVVVLAAALAGLGAWVAVDRLTGGGVDEVTALLDRNIAALNSGDAAAMAANYAEDGVLNKFGGEFRGRQAIEAQMQDEVDDGTKVTRVSEVATNGEYAAFFIEWTNELAGGPNSGADLSVFQLENGKIAAQWEFYLPDWPPFELGG